MYAWAAEAELFSYTLAEANRCVILWFSLAFPANNDGHSQTFPSVLLLMSNALALPAAAALRAFAKIELYE